MAKQPSSGRVTLAGRLPRAIRVALFSVIAAGGGYVFHLGATLGYLTFEKPESAPTASSRMPGGALVICGGGLLPENVRGRFLELAGGTAAKIVVIPTANGFADGPPVSPPPVGTTPGNAGDDGQARPRPTRQENLNPCPLHGLATRTSDRSGRTPTWNRSSGATV